jgi:anaerobic glycerol-3-phosphate dehydrogenase
MFILITGGYAGEKRALKLLEKGKYSKLVDYLEKSIKKG